MPLLTDAPVFRDGDGLNTWTHPVLAQHSDQVVNLMCNQSGQTVLEDCDLRMPVNPDR